MEAGIGEGSFDQPDPGHGDAEAHQAQTHIHPVCAPEYLSQICRVIVVAADLVVVQDHGANDGTVMVKLLLFQVVFRQTGGRLQVVKRAGQPDAGIVEEGGNLQSFPFLFIQGSLCGYQIDEPVDVVAVGGLLLAKAFRLVIKKCIYAG